MTLFDKLHGAYHSPAGRLIRQYRIPLSFIFAGLLLLLYDRGCSGKAPGVAGQHPHTYAGEGRALSYQLYLPADYESRREWPVILYLHGASLRGSKVARVTRYGLPRMLKKRTDFPFIVISPQCPAGESWEHLTVELTGLLDEIARRYRVDEDRVYLTGISLGGGGAWHLAAQHPERFAALAPLCGYGDPALAPAYKDLPVWIFHGALDRQVPVSISDEMAAAIRRAGGKVKYSRYPRENHNIVEMVYQDQALYDWFLTHRR